MLAGVVSFVEDHCVDEGLPGTYTSLAAFHGWIVENTKLLREAV